MEIPHHLAELWNFKLKVKHEGSQRTDWWKEETRSVLRWRACVPQLYRGIRTGCVYGAKL